MRVCTAGSLTIATILATARAGAELPSAGGLRHSFIVVTEAPDDGAAVAPPPPPMQVLVDGPPRSSGASMWRLPVFWVGLPGSRSWLTSTHVELVVRPMLDDELSLCLGIRCPAVWMVLRPDGEPQTYGAAASTRVVASLGAVGAAALSLFANPTPAPKRLGAVALRLAPMFALGGAGLELRGASW